MCRSVLTMKTEPAMPLDVARYLADTQGLTRAEHGSYMLLIMSYWANAGPLLNDDQSLKMIARCPDAEWSRTKGIMERFFDVSNGVWKHTFLDSEIARSIARKKQVSEASAKGVEARRVLGQLPPSGQPSGQSGGSTALRISHEKELDRVEKAIEKIKQAGTVTAAGTTYTAHQLEDLKGLKARRKELLASLGFRV